MISVDEIVAIYGSRAQATDQIKSRMRTLRDYYNGDVIVPLPELNSDEQSAVANLLAQGLDQTAMRIASTRPDIYCPPTDPARKRSRDNSEIKRKALFGWWENSRMDLQLAKRARYLIGYSNTVTQLRWNETTGCPEWHLRDPLTAYPATLLGVDDMRPRDCIFGYERPLGWLHSSYPEAGRVFQADSDAGPDTAIELIEYVGPEETVLIAMRGPVKTGMFATSPYGSESNLVVELERVTNRLEQTPVVIAQRISLDASQGQFDGILGMYQMQARLMALEVIAVQKGVFPDTWLVGRAGETPQIVNPADGLTGEVGVIRGGDLKDMQMQPGYMTNPAIDRLERAQRLTAGIPAEFGGESPTNIRTGRRGDAVLSAAVDFPVQEAQRIMARALQEENKLAIGMAKKYAGNKGRTFYVTTKNAKGRVEYTPNTNFDSTENVVSYSQAGADINNLVIGGGQRVGMGTMSKRSFMAIDPLVEDPEFEHDSVISEQLEEALLNSIQQQAMEGAIPPADLARIMELVSTNQMELAGAVEKVQKEAQERQAEQVDAAAPEAQPGLAQPGMGAEARSVAAPPNQPPPEMAQLLASL
jgi:hypothetical protein|tara:strand:- start:17366 stop:19129 length:1764 start_codon:yes stop_codon:yes gene_type:complete